MSETQQNVERFVLWLDEVVAKGEWRSEADFIASTLIIRSEVGTRRMTREQWAQSVLSTRPPDWRLTVHDLVAQGDRLGIAFTTTETHPRTGAKIAYGLMVMRFADGQFAEIWSAPRSGEVGPWPNLSQSRAEWTIAAALPSPGEATIAAALERYFEIRQTHEAEGLRELFVEPMVVHGPGPTRTEILDEFIQRVATELEITPGLKFEAPDCFVAGNKAFVRWSYWQPNPSLAAPSPFAGLTLYAFSGGQNSRAVASGLNRGNRLGIAGHAWRFRPEQRSETGHLHPSEQAHGNGSIAPIEAFRTPASVHPLSPVTGRRPKTLNDSGHSEGQSALPLVKRHERLPGGTFQEQAAARRGGRRYLSSRFHTGPQRVPDLGVPSIRAVYAGRRPEYREVSDDTDDPTSRRCRRRRMRAHHS